MPVVANKMRARYSPTCAVKVDSIDIKITRIVKTSNAI